MTEHDHDTDHDPASDPPGAVSDQNSEEAQSGHRKDGTHPEPRTSGERADRHDGDTDERSSGASGEGSQSTGHRHSAG